MLVIKWTWLHLHTRWLCFTLGSSVWFASQQSSVVSKSTGSPCDWWILIATPGARSSGPHFPLRELRSRGGESCPESPEGFWRSGPQTHVCLQSHTRHGPPAHLTAAQGCGEAQQCGSCGIGMGIWFSIPSWCLPCCWTHQCPLGS